jgi:hypothetical protein
LRHAKDESKRDFARVYKGCANSLKVNGIFRRQAMAVGLVYNEVPTTWSACAPWGKSVRTERNKGIQREVQQKLVQNVGIRLEIPLRNEGGQC